MRRDKVPGLEISLTLERVLELLFSATSHYLGLPLLQDFGEQVKLVLARLTVLCRSLSKVAKRQS